MSKIPNPPDAPLFGGASVASSNYSKASDPLSFPPRTAVDLHGFEAVLAANCIASSGAIRRGQQARPYSVFAAIYDKAMGEPALPSVLDAFSESRRRFDIGTASMADIGCGTGLFLKYLSRFGGRLIGVDRSPWMLRIAERRLRDARVELLRMDMRRLALPASVETLTCTFDTINYLLSRSDLAATLAAFARNVLPGGTLLFDFIPQGACRGRSEVRQSVQIGPIRSEWRIRIDPQGRGSVAALRIYKPGDDRPVRIELHRQRWHGREEVARCLGGAGLEMLDCRPAEPGGDGDWLHVAARRTSADGASK